MRASILAAPSPSSISSSCLPPQTIALHTKSILTKPISSHGLLLLHRTTSHPRILNLKCRSSNNNGGNSDETRTVLDAFFLGKAFAEAFNERLESAVGEFLSTVGRWQAEQQNQIQEFQEQVLEKAKRAKDQAAKEALEEKGQILRPETSQEPKINGVTITTTASDSNGTDTLSIKVDPSPGISDED